jgi:hypothetical protein
MLFMHNSVSTSKQRNDLENRKRNVIAKSGGEATFLLCLQQPESKRKHNASANLYEPSHACFQRRTNAYVHDHAAASACVSARASVYVSVKASDCVSVKASVSAPTDSLHTLLPSLRPTHIATHLPA